MKKKQVWKIRIVFRDEGEHRERRREQGGQERRRGRRREDVARHPHCEDEARHPHFFFSSVLLARLVTENLYFFSRIFSLRLKKMALLTHQVEEEYSKGEELLISILKGIKYVCCLALYNLTGSDSYKTHR